MLGIPVLVCARPVAEGWVLLHSWDIKIDEVLALLLMLLVSSR